MSTRPTECRVPENVWFKTREQADFNVRRKLAAGLGRWYSWRDGDHYHVRPKKNRYGD